jgi:hypothetical protein
VQGGPADHLGGGVIPQRFGPIAGNSIRFVVVAQDQYGNRATGYGGTVHFTSSDTSPGVVLPADSTVPTLQYFQATLNQAGEQTLTATDTVTPSITKDLSVHISPASAARIRLDVPAAAKAGQPFYITLTLLDRFGNVATGEVLPYTGTIHFTSTDPLAMLPPDYTFHQVSCYKCADSGIRYFPVTLVVLGNQTITATDVATSSITGTSPDIDVTLPLPY